MHWEQVPASWWRKYHDEARIHYKGGDVIVPVLDLGKHK